MGILYSDDFIFSKDDGYFIFSKAPGLESDHQMQFSVTRRTLVVGSLLHCKEEVGGFYSLSRQSSTKCAEVQD